MFKNELKRKFKNPFNLLWFILLPVGWFLGTEIVRTTIDGLKERAVNIANGQEVSQQMIDHTNDVIKSINGFTVFAEGISEFYLPIAIVLLVGLLVSSSFVYDKNTGFGNFVITRTQFKKYYISKVFSVFLSAFISIFFVLTLVLFASLIVYSAKAPTEAFNFSMLIDNGAKRLFFSHHWLACFIMIFTLSVFGGLYALLGMGVSLITSNRFVVCASPLAIYLFCIIVPQLFSIQAPIAKIIAWIFPMYFTGIFIGNDFWYTNLPISVTYCIHLAAIAVPAAVLLFFLYRKNAKQYIR